MGEKEIGKITHYYGHISVGIIELKEALKVGETIHVKGGHDDFTQVIDSMQIDHKNVPGGNPGDQVGVKINSKVHPGDKVYKVE